MTGLVVSEPRRPAQPMRPSFATANPLGIRSWLRLHPGDPGRSPAWLDTAQVRFRQAHKHSVLGHYHVALRQNGALKPDKSERNDRDPQSEERGATRSTGPWASP